MPGEAGAGSAARTAAATAVGSSVVHRGTSAPLARRGQETRGLSRQLTVLGLVDPLHAGRGAGAHLEVDAAQTERQLGMRLESVVARPQWEALVQKGQRPMSAAAVA